MSCLGENVQAYKLQFENSEEADMHHAFDEITKIRNTVSSEGKNNVRESQKKQVLQYAKKNKFGKNKSTPEKGLSKGMMWWYLMQENLQEKVQKWKKNMERTL